MQRVNEIKGWFVENRNKTDKRSQIIQNKELKRISHTYEIRDGRRDTTTDPSGIRNTLRAHPKNTDSRQLENLQ